MYLLRHGRELEDVERLVVHGGTLVDVYDHTSFTAATEETLKVVGQLALPEGNMLQQPGGKATGQGVNSGSNWTFR